MTTANEDFQIRRPNRLYEKPLKKNLALLFDVICFNFYGKNPDDREFRISWMELKANYGFSISNKEYLREKLQMLEDENYISDLNISTYGFSYRFENTFLSYDEILKPKTWTFLNFSLMKELNYIEYKLYVLAYKFFNFTKENHHEYENQTRFLEIEEFIETFNQSVGANIDHTKNRLITRARDAIDNLKELGIEIDMHLKTFGRPVIGVKFLFRKVPKLKAIISKAVDFTVKTAKRTFQKVKSSISQKSENWREYSDNKKTEEHLEMVNVAERHAMRNFLTMDFFPAVMKAKYFHWLDDGKKWIKEQFQKDDGTFEISLPMAETVFKNYQRLKSYTKMYRNGLFGDGEFQYATKVDKKIFITAKHPTIPSIEAKILVLEL